MGCNCGKRRISTKQSTKVVRTGQNSSPTNNSSNSLRPKRRVIRTVR